MPALPQSLRQRVASIAATTADHYWQSDASDCSTRPAVNGRQVELLARPDGVQMRATAAKSPIFVARHGSRPFTPSPTSPHGPRTAPPAHSHLPRSVEPAVRRRCRRHTALGSPAAPAASSMPATTSSSLTSRRDAVVAASDIHSLDRKAGLHDLGLPDIARERVHEPDSLPAAGGRGATVLRSGLAEPTLARGTVGLTMG